MRVIAVHDARVLQVMPDGWVSNQTNCGPWDLLLRATNASKLERPLSPLTGGSLDDLTAMYR